MTGARPAVPAPRTASEWFAARLRPHDAAIEREFERWVTADARHAEEYALCEITWELAGRAAEGLAPEPARVPRAQRWVAWTAAIFAGAALAATTAYWFTPTTPVEWTTGPGEQRTVSLDDGSVVTLNTRSALEVQLGRKRREVHLLQGEAHFAVAADPSRPFIVATPLGIARVVGTRFNVYLRDDRVEVTTIEGTVFVHTAEEREGVLTTAGHRATLIRGSSRPALDEADLARIENWREKRLEFDGVPLEEALREFSRYTALPIRADSSDLARLPVTAVLHIGDTPALRTALEGALGLTLERRTEEWVVTARRQ